jgi:ABC-2 type transport system permease protein
LVAIAAAIGIFQFVLTRLAPAPDEVSWVATLLMTLPPELRALVGNEVAVTPGGFLAIGYSHPFFIILLSVWVVRVSSAAVAGEVGLGTMDVLASRPVPRWYFIGAGMIASAVGLALIAVCGWTGTAIGLWTRPIGTDASAFLPVVSSAWLLFAAWGAVGLLVSTTRRDAGQAISWITTALAASFVLDYLARLWAPIAWLRPLSLFRYYEPQVVLTSGLPASSAVVLAFVLVLGLVGSAVVMDRRDL